MVQDHTDAPLLIFPLVPNLPKFHFAVKKKNDEKQKEVSGKY